GAGRLDERQHDQRVAFDEHIVSRDRDGGEPQRRVEQVQPVGGDHELGGVGGADGVGARDRARVVNPYVATGALLAPLDGDRDAVIGDEVEGVGGHAPPVDGGDERGGQW